MKNEVLEKELETFQEQFFKKATAWFLKETEKICTEYNIYVTDFGRLDITDVDGDIWQHRGCDKHELYDEVWDKFYELGQYLTNDLGFRYQTFVFTEDEKIIF